VVLRKWPGLRLACLLGLVVALAFIRPAEANEQTTANARQAVALFLQSCVHFSGDRDGLRAWAVKVGLTELQGKAKDGYLYGLPGVVYDASTQGPNLVLVSEDSGSCSTVTQSADGGTVVGELERRLRDGRVELNMTENRPDPKEQALYHREYTAALGTHAWQMLVSTVQGQNGGEAMLTANPW
jgi:hypothetical protein